MLGVAVGAPTPDKPPGAEVFQVFNPAAQAGLTTGDVIVAVDGRTIASAPELNAALARFHPGDVVNVAWSADGSLVAHSAAITLARRGA
jgi:S1-C subfamily serine protease